MCWKWTEVGDAHTRVILKEVEQTVEARET